MPRRPVGRWVTGKARKYVPPQDIEEFFQNDCFDKNHNFSSEIIFYELKKLKMYVNLKIKTYPKID